MASCELIIRPSQSSEDGHQLDELLWEVLWKPIGLPRDVRSSFEMDGQKLELVVLTGSMVVAGLVAYQVSDTETEIRHIAVRPDRQRQCIGTRLVTELIGGANKSACVVIRTYARNTSLGFFEKLGFRPVESWWIEHPAFTAHGIRFRHMECLVAKIKM